MVGHSQLDSDMLEASPAPTGNADDSVVQHAHAAPAEEPPMGDDDTDSGTEAGNDRALEAGQGGLSSPEAPPPALEALPMHVPRPGRKRKRSGSRHGCRQDAAPVSLCLLVSKSGSSSVMSICCCNTSAKGLC